MASVPAPTPFPEPAAAIWDDEDLDDVAEAEIPVDVHGYRTISDELDAGSADSEVRGFITSFRKQFREGKLNDQYEHQFRLLTERFYKNGPWPRAEEVLDLMEKDNLFIGLYQEMYYRHIYSRLDVTLAQRGESFDNYVDLFSYFLEQPDNADFDLPNQWLFDIIDEFLYQFQSFWQYRSRELSAEENQLLQSSEAAAQWWNHKTVLFFLDSFVQKSQIVQILEKERASGQTTTSITEQGPGHVVRMLGYYSLVGLLRIHTMFGDYNLALKSIDAIDLNKKGAFAKIPACYVTLYYYLGFSYLMLHRYVDAIRAFAHILSYTSRMRSIHKTSYQYDNIMKTSDKVYGLLAIAISLHPQRIDEYIHNALREKQGDKLARMQNREERAFGEVFRFACPKFISPANVQSEEDEDARGGQLEVFMVEVHKQLVLAVVRSYLKLYSTITVSKLASFIKGQSDAPELKEVSAEGLLALLAAIKTNSLQVVSDGTGRAGSGVRTNVSDFDVTVQDDMITITENRVPRRFGDFFVRHIGKLDDLIADLSKTPAAASSRR